MVLCRRSSEFFLSVSLSLVAVQIRQAIDAGFRDLAGAMVALPQQVAERIVASKIDEVVEAVNWARLVRHTRPRPSLALFDGYDELLQASGKAFSGYLLKVQRFQQDEADAGRPIATFVTSRITLIDKAEMPRGATILRLLEFDGDPGWSRRQHTSLDRAKERDVIGNKVLVPYPGTPYFEAPGHHQRETLVMKGSGGMQGQ